MCASLNENRFNYLHHKRVKWNATLAPIIWTRLRTFPGQFFRSPDKMGHVSDANARQYRSWSSQNQFTNNLSLSNISMDVHECGRLIYSRSSKIVHMYYNFFERWLTWCISYTMSFFSLRHTTISFVALSARGIFNRADALKIVRRNVMCVNTRNSR